MSLGRVLVEEFQPEVLKWLRERVELVVVNPWVEPERWELEIVRVDAVISRKGKITRAQMEQSGGRLRIIARTGVGVDPSRVDLEAAKELKIWVTNQPGSNAVSVAELVFGQLIALVRHTHAADRAVKENRWSDYLKFMGTELAGKTLGIVGMVNVGALLALRARAFTRSNSSADGCSVPLKPLAGSVSRTSVSASVLSASRARIRLAAWSALILPSSTICKIFLRSSEDIICLLPMPGEAAQPAQQ